MIPGNPSVPGIYDPFLENVVDGLHGKDQTIYSVLPHLGQCNQVFARHTNLRIHDVIEDHKRKIVELITQHDPKDVTLIGHSLGSAITITLYKELKDQVDHFIILCPFLGPSENNKGYLKLFANPVTRMGMEGITYSALRSQRISRLIFKRWLGENPFNDHIPNEIRKPYYTKNFFTLVSNYFKDFSELSVKEDIKEMNPEKTFFVFAPNDYWVPDETIFHLPPQSRFRRLNNISHDFCLREDQFTSVAKVVSDHLREKYLL